MDVDISLLKEENAKLKKKSEEQEKRLIALEAQMEQLAALVMAKSTATPARDERAETPVIVMPPQDQTQDDVVTSVGP